MTLRCKRLFYKISRYGIKDPIPGWIRSSMSNRSQCVMINGCKSDSVPVTSGIPKRYLHGLLLFVIFINDLSDSAMSNVHLFDDDTKNIKVLSH